MTMLRGVLADRDKWSAVGECPIEKTMTLAGTKSAMLLMREAYYGTTRFDDFCPPRRHHQGRHVGSAVRVGRRGDADPQALPRAR